MKLRCSIYSILFIVLLGIEYKSIAQTTTFSYTGATQTYLVPPGVFSVSIQAYGAQGANAMDTLPSRHSGGKGSYVSGNLAVVPGEILEIFVGGAGSTTGLGSFNGGAGGGLSAGTGWCAGGYAGGGGGASDIRVGGAALGNRVIVAAGGGGAGRDYCNGTLHPCGCGGNGGPGDGNGSPADTCGYGCAGSTVNFGSRGLLVLYDNAGPDDGGGTTSGSGTLGIGGTGAPGVHSVAGGGGGGGYYGGGGGGGETAPGGTGVAGGGGGGGSSFAGGVTDSVIVSGTNTGNGVVVITTSCTPPTSGTIGGPIYFCSSAPTIFTDSTGSPGGSWYSSDTSVAMVSASSGIVTGMAAGTATISYIIVTTCGTAFADTTVTISIPPFVDSITGATNLCTGLSTILSDSAMDGLWMSGDTLVATISDGVVTGVSAGTATITYFIPGSGGCPDTSITKTITISPPPFTGHITGPSSICPDSSGFLYDTVSGGIWSSSDTSVATVSLGLVRGITSGTATISYAVMGICATIPATQVITVRPHPDAGRITTDYANAFCTGETITIHDTITGGAWTRSNDNVSQTGLHVTALTAGADTIFYSVTTTCGTATDTLPLLISPPPPPVTGPLVVCANATTALSDSVTHGTWASSNSAVVAVAAGSGDVGIVTGLVPGTAMITYAIDTGCKTYATITVLPIPNAGIIIGPSQLCVGNVATLSDAITGGKWGSGDNVVAEIDSNDGTLDALSAGTAIVSYTIVSPVNGCNNTAKYEVVVEPAPNVAGIISPVSCYGGSDGSILATASGGSGTYQYQWPDGTTSPTHNDLAAGNYLLTVIDQSDGCTNTNSFIITQPDSLSIFPIETIDTCNSGKGRILLNVTGGTLPYHYLWSNKGTANSIADLTEGTYTLLVTDGNNCPYNFSYNLGDTCEDIRIWPNPVTDNIHINGVGNGDMLKLIDMWGQVVWETKTTNPDIELPPYLPNALYCAVITTSTGSVYLKIVVAR